MPHRQREARDRLEAELAQHGVTEVSYSQRGSGHIQAAFSFNGGRIKYIFACSPSDFRANQNMLSDVRRIMGVKRKIRGHSERRSKTPQTFLGSPKCPKSEAE